MIPSLEALEQLKSGNQRFVKGESDLDKLTNEQRRNNLLAGQQPFAIILACSDSRVPVEIIFDQGLGDLFVIRVAGNIVAPSQIGSVEFAAAEFDTRLVVVLGHTSCGAVTATLNELERPSQNRSPNLHSIVERIQPAIQGLLATELRHDRAALIHHAVRANIRAAANHLRHGSRLLENLIQDNELLVVCAEYSLETGRVEFFDAPLEEI